ncbi:transketolase [Pseudolabrys sp. FHR47]|uniref:transketolase n=1 Tax=Pseudolabrys sp. FHR47 TaxID=2562284 RepID=UPI0010BEF594|nr:transketolase [Pseudolabrys sp. FHR47]
MSTATRELARHLRARTLRMVHRAKASHVGSCFSAADILAVLYGEVLKVDPSRPDWADRDRFIMSKGHAAAILYAVLAAKGFFADELLDSYSQDGSQLAGHVTATVPGIQVSTGSLGHGLPIGCGMALAAKHDRKDWRVFVVMSDGECNEGSNWEAALFGARFGLDNLVAIIDYNKLQGFGGSDDVLGLAPLADKWKSFGWTVIELDGHDHDALTAAAARSAAKPGKPTMIVAHTTKGKGVSFMEGSLAWHYKSPSDADFAAALAEIEAEGARPS